MFICFFAVRQMDMCPACLIHANGALIVRLVRYMHKLATIAWIIYALEKIIYRLKKTIYSLELERLFTAQKKTFYGLRLFLQNS